MKRFFAVSAAIVLSLATVAPAMARMQTMEKLSRRLVRSEALLRQRVPSGAMPVDLLLRERQEAQVDATGLSQLGRARYRTVRGASTNTKLNIPSRRTLRERVEGSWLVLPPSIVQTGGEEAFVRPTRRSTIERARWMNGFIPE